MREDGDVADCLERGEGIFSERLTRRRILYIQGPMKGHGP